MTVSTTTSRIVYAGNGVTTIFAFPYRFLVNGDLDLTLFAADGTSETLVLTTDYTVTGADSDAGGSVTMVVAPAVGETLVIRRIVDLTQETDYISGDAFPAESHERALDKLTMSDQQLQEQMDRSLTAPLDDVTFSGQLPPIVAERFLRINASGTAIELVDALNAGELVVSPFIETLLDDADDAAARTTLGAQAAGSYALSGSVGSSGLTMGTARILGRDTAGTGAVEELTGAQAQSLLPVQQTRVDIASASTVNLTTGAESTDHINITGTTTITGFTVAAGRLLFVRFAGVLTLTNGAGLVTQRGSNIVTAAGDTCILRATAADTVEVLNYVGVPGSYGTPIRALNTVYTNTSSRFRWVQGYCTNGGSGVIEMQIGGSPVHRFTAPAAAPEMPFHTIVPPGSTYQLNNSGSVTITQWKEMDL